MLGGNDGVLRFHLHVWCLAHHAVNDVAIDRAKRGKPRERGWDLGPGTWDLRPGFHLQFSPRLINHLSNRWLIKRSHACWQFTPGILLDKTDPPLPSCLTVAVYSLMAKSSYHRSRAALEAVRITQRSDGPERNCQVFARCSQSRLRPSEEIPGRPRTLVND